MLLEVGQESDGVFTKSQLSKYQCRTYFDQASLAIDILDDKNHRNYVVTNLFSWVRNDISSRAENWRVQSYSAVTFSSYVIG